MMNTKYTVILLIIVVVATVVYFTDQKTDNDTNIASPTTVNNSQIIETKPDHAISPPQVTQNRPLDDALLHIAQLIAPASNEVLKDSWQQEYTCDGLDNCNTKIFNARSYEDALWLKRRGYPTRSMLNMLGDLSKKDLHELSDNGNLNAKNLLALNALNNGNFKTARSLARASSAYSTHVGSRETFAYRLLAEAYLRDNDRISATLYLRIASLLGDTEATAHYEQLTARSASTVVDSTNRIAFGILSGMLKTNINDWNNDPRPES